MGYFIQSATASPAAPPRPTQRLRPPVPVDNSGETAKNEVPEFFTVESGYRFYSPDLGRWLSRDPIGEEGGANLVVAFENSGMDIFDRLGLIGVQYTAGFSQTITYSIDQMEMPGSKGPYTRAHWIRRYFKEQYTVSHRLSFEVQQGRLVWLSEATRNVKFAGEYNRTKVVLTESVFIRPTPNEWRIVPYEKGRRTYSSLDSDTTSKFREAPDGSLTIYLIARSTIDMDIGKRKGVDGTDVLASVYGNLIQLATGVPGFDVMLSSLREAPARFGPGDMRAGYVTFIAVKVCGFVVEIVDMDNKNTLTVPTANVTVSGPQDTYVRLGDF